ncbi:hypothetical protein PUNSTDRAFT_122413 [Punctularia strigosozonata HHB-11173 SS5]|uniref:uncharacterized protein n=1 Tax=Punctularia strigosozonata (strain HHB-11173) TaxID=741275 RepID=UPI000441766F|nr:uncharacterized protein PUNSTDRAFT_122413 [Punctularia strigosozonata HHB-11173 SS5]EIN05562.1 hypothetical protein PUNSTDRAFT_122413 [Punctularia strigosozonata HHB-11173 SS5]
MPLVLHPESRCDICLDAYTSSTPENWPHAISCGHIFCKSCLRMVNPVACPLCRKRFDIVKVTKLHVDRYSPPERAAVGLPGDAGHAETDTHHEALALLQSLALINLERTPQSQVESTMRSVDDFLESQSEEEPVLRPLRSARQALENSRRYRESAKKYKHRLRDMETAKAEVIRRAEMDRQTSEVVEASLQKQLQEERAEWEKYITELQQSLSRAHTSVDSNIPLASAHSEISALRAELAQAKSQLENLQPQFHDSRSKVDLAALRREVERLRGLRLDDGFNQLAVVQSELADVKGQNAALRAEIERMRNVSHSSSSGYSGTPPISSFDEHALLNPPQLTPAHPDRTPSISIPVRRVTSNPLPPPPQPLPDELLPGFVRNRLFTSTPGSPSISPPSMPSSAASGSASSFASSLSQRFEVMDGVRPSSRAEKAKGSDRVDERRQGSSSRPPMDQNSTVRARRPTLNGDHRTPSADAVQPQILPNVSMSYTNGSSAVHANGHGAGRSHTHHRSEPQNIYQDPPPQPTTGARSAVVSNAHIMAPVPDDDSSRRLRRDSTPRDPDMVRYEYQYGYGSGLMNGYGMGYENGIAQAYADRTPQARSQSRQVQPQAGQGPGVRILGSLGLDPGYGTDSERQNFSDGEARRRGRERRSSTTSSRGGRDNSAPAGSEGRSFEARAARDSMADFSLLSLPAPAETSNGLGGNQRSRLGSSNTHVIGPSPSDPVSSQGDGRSNASQWGSAQSGSGAIAGSLSALDIGLTGGGQNTPASRASGMVAPTASTEAVDDDEDLEYADHDEFFTPRQHPITIPTSRNQSAYSQSRPSTGRGHESRSSTSISRTGSSSRHEDWTHVPSRASTSSHVSRSHSRSDTSARPPSEPPAPISIQNGQQPTRTRPISGRMPSQPALDMLVPASTPPENPSRPSAPPPRPQPHRQVTFPANPETEVRHVQDDRARTKSKRRSSTSFLSMTNINTSQTSSATPVLTPPAPAPSQPAAPPPMATTRSLTTDQARAVHARFLPFIAAARPSAAPYVATATATAPTNAQPIYVPVKGSAESSRSR